VFVVFKILQSTDSQFKIHNTYIQTSIAVEFYSFNWTNLNTQKTQL